MWVRRVCIRNDRQQPDAVRVRINEAIRAAEVRLIDDEGKQIGVVNLSVALNMANERGLDLVEVAPDARPPVVKIMDYGKYRYLMKKKQAEAKKRQKVMLVKEVKFRPRTDTHDYEFKRNHIIRFLEQGDKVKCGVFFRGREMTHPELGYEILARLCQDLENLADVERPPAMEGRLLVLYLVPRKS